MIKTSAANAPAIVLPPTATAYSFVQAKAKRYVRNWVPEVTAGG